MGSDEEQIWRQQHHEDMGGVSARLTAAETGIQDLGRRFDGFVRGVDARFDSLQQTIVNSNRDLSQQIGSANVAFAASGKTNWGNIFAGVSVLVAIGGIFGGALSIRLGENTADIKTLQSSTVSRDEWYKAEARLTESVNKLASSDESWLTRITDRQIYDERTAVKPEAVAEFTKRVDERDEREAHDLDTRLSKAETRIETVDAGIVKRPEIMAALEALGARIDGLAHREEAHDADIKGLSPPSRVFDEIFSELRELRSGREGRVTEPAR